MTSDNNPNKFSTTDYEVLLNRLKASEHTHKDDVGNHERPTTPTSPEKPQNTRPEPRNTRRRATRTESAPTRNKLTQTLEHPANSTLLPETGIRLYVYRRNNDRTTINATARTIAQIADLYARGYLYDGCVCWFNAAHPRLGIWALAEQSAHIRCYETFYPGYVRMDRSTVRFASNTTDTIKMPDATYGLGSIPQIAGARATVLVKHDDPDATLKYLTREGRPHLVHPDRFTYPPFTVIDLEHYQRLNDGTRNIFELSHAVFNGAELMAYGRSSLEAEHIKSHMADYALELTPDVLSEGTQVAHSLEQQTTRLLTGD